MQVKVKKLNDNAVIPVYAKQGDSGFDLVASEDVIIIPNETEVIDTGLAFEIPEGYEMQIRPRSGITRKTDLRVQLGTIDSGYRGSVGVIVDNIYPSTDGMSRPKDVNGKEVLGMLGIVGSYLIRKGDRIVQGVIVPVVRAELVETDYLSDSERNTGGFGHTGV